MRYTHNIKSVHKRKQALKISLVFTVLLLILIFYVGFTTLDAQRFFLGFFVSLIRVLAAYLISLIIATGLTLSVTSSERMEQITLPILDALQSFPSFAIFPLLIVWMGKNSSVTILILVIEMIWPILFTLISAKKQLQKDLVEAAYIFGARGRKFLLYVVSPLLFPAFITGSIVAWGEAWEAIIAAEIIVGVKGVGTYLAEAANLGQTHVLVVGILLLLLLLFILNKYLWVTLLNLSTKYQQE